MVEIFPPQTVLTQSTATDELNARGLDAFGLTMPSLSPVWAGSNPAEGAYDASALTLALTAPRAPFRGIRSFTTEPHRFAGRDGAALSGPTLVFALHPQAARRLEALVAARFGQPRQRPVPVAMLVRNAAIPAVPPAPERFLSSETLDAGDGARQVSFHDARGLIIDPIAVAHLLRGLLTWLPGLLSTIDAETVASPGGLDAVADLADTGSVIHVIDPHGHVFRPTGAAARLKVTDAEDAEAAEITDGGLVTLSAGQGLGRAEGDDPEDAGDPPLRWGWALNATLGRDRLTPPALPVGVTLARQFLRVMAVELPWHLRGNRSAAPVRGIPPHDHALEAWMLPAIRDPVPGFALLSDGMQVLGAMGEMVSSLSPGGQGSHFAVAVSPMQDAGLMVPPSSGGEGRWPAFPPPDTGMNLTAATDPRRDLLARWRAAGDEADADRDVVLLIPAEGLPQGCHVRAYPRRFVSIAAIGEEQSFVRGDGGAAIRAGAGVTRLLLRNPFGLAPAEARPNPAVVTVDLVVVTRSGQRRLFSSVAVPVMTDVAEGMPDGQPAMGGSPLMTPQFDAFLTGLGTRGIAPAPLFGQPRPTPPGPAPLSVLELVRRLASEGQPRQGPRLPTQARFETVLALGSAPQGVTPLAWQAVLTGARLDAESRCAAPEMGNPGNPAGVDLHATGVAFGGRLAYDAALASLKRAQPVLPFAADQPCWLNSLGGDNWDLPAADTSGTVAATLLNTVAALCDTPELALMPPIPPGTTVQGTVDNLANAMGLPDSPDFDVLNADERLIPELRREQSIAMQGRRDALWALARAFGEARELVFIDGPAFAATARDMGASPPAHAIDLVALLAARLAANPALKVLICVPRHPDFAVEHAGWVRTALAHRRDAIDRLAAVARARVAAFHPIGFPGRATAIRSSTIIVDDAWCLTGAAHLRRRGMTFDGSLAVAAFDRTLVDGYSASIADFRRRVMAARLGVAPATAVADASAYWVRLARPDSAFELVADLLEQGGLGRCAPVWAGPTDNTQGQSDDVTDPDGTAGTDFVTLLASLLMDG